MKEAIRILRLLGQVDAEVLEVLIVLSERYPESRPLHLVVICGLFHLKDERYDAELERRKAYLEEVYHLLPTQLPEEDTPTFIEEFLADEEPIDGEGDETSEIIAQFLQRSTVGVGEGEAEGETFEYGEEETVSYETPLPETVTTAEVDDLTVATEAMARLYIRNGDYQSAIEIFRHLDLENSEKSGYFAEQIEFLEILLSQEGEA